MTRLVPSLRRIALISFGGIGDAILFSPVIEDIRDALPTAELTLVLEDRSAGVAPLLPGVNHVCPVQVQGVPRSALFFKLLGILRAGNFDAVVATGSSVMIPVLLALSGIAVRVGFDGGPLHRLLLTAAAPLCRQQYAGRMYAALSQALLTRVLGQTTCTSMTGGGLPHLARVDASNIRWAERLLGGTQADGAQAGKPRVLIHPGVSRVSVDKHILKSWPVSHWAPFIRRLLDQGCQVTLAGGPDDGEAVHAILAALPAETPGLSNLYGQTRSLTDLAALIAAVDCLVAVDSSPLHIAVGLGTPVVAMFGPTDERKLLPPDPRFIAVHQQDLACRPCLWDVRQTSCDQPVCLDVAVEDMAAAVFRVLEIHSMT
ncbi:MAG: glycosyltransferase family 9 protein [Candidatus Melainabacteria bacterium]